MAGVWSSQKKEGSPQTIPGIKDNLRREFLPRAWLKKKQGNVRMLLEYA